MNHFENKTFSYVFEHLRGISVPTYVVLFFFSGEFSNGHPLHVGCRGLQMSPVTELEWSQGVFQFPFPRAFPLHTVLRERGELDKRMTGTVKGSIIYISLSHTQTHRHACTPNLTRKSYT